MDPEWHLEVYLAMEEDRRSDAKGQSRSQASSHAVPAEQQACSGRGNGVAFRGAVRRRVRGLIDSRCGMRAVRKTVGVHIPVVTPLARCDG